MIEGNAIYRAGKTSHLHGGLGFVIGLLDLILVMCLFMKQGCFSIGYRILAAEKPIALFGL